MLKKNNPMNEFPILSLEEGIPLFYPKVSRQGFVEVNNTLKTRWIGQGPKVDLFEKKFKLKFLKNHSALAVGSGTDALHLAYLLSNIKKNDEVLVPVFTCTATNIPLLYIGAKPVFVDIDPKTMNICIEDVKRKISRKTKAVVCVDYGGIPNNYKELNKICKKNNLILISDAAHSLGSKYFGNYIGSQADFTIFSFQAIKTLTTGDGGLLSIKDHKLLEKAKRLRWFGIDRSSKQLGIWENDIREIGYKYQMNDISASLGLASLKNIDQIIKKRNLIFKYYEERIKNSSVKILGCSKTKEYFNSAWLMTIIVSGNRIGLMKKLRENKIESGQVHYRNDRYSIFGGRRNDLHQMDLLEDRYLVLPLHPLVSEKNVDKICNLINQGW
jgi:dTDP-4-amino-4,6-dideoxygalactose transaminase